MNVGNKSDKKGLTPFFSFFSFYQLQKNQNNRTFSWLLPSSLYQPGQVSNYAVHWIQFPRAYIFRPAKYTSTSIASSEKSQDDDDENQQQQHSARRQT
jgi:hypothetical protein